jgi:rhodanese-related sulfurtransferase
MFFAAPIKELFSPWVIRAAVFRALILVGLAVMLGVASVYVLPERIAWRGDWEHFVEAQAYEMGLTLASLDAVRQAVDRGEFILLDARPAADFHAGHIPGALSFPADAPEAGADALFMLTPQDALLIYCSGYECDDSLVLANYLQETGFTNIVIYAGGYNEWQQYREQP